MRFGDYFRRERRHRPDRADITIEMCERVVAEPIRRESQKKGRTGYWGYVEEKERYLRVVVEPDGETIFNAFWDRGFRRAVRRERRKEKDGS